MQHLENYAKCNEINLNFFFVNQYSLCIYFFSFRSTRSVTLVLKMGRPCNNLLIDLCSAAEMGRRWTTILGRIFSGLREFLAPGISLHRLRQHVSVAVSKFLPWRQDISSSQAFADRLALKYCMALSCRPPLRSTFLLMRVAILFDNLAETLPPKLVSSRRAYTHGTKQLYILKTRLLSTLLTTHEWVMSRCNANFSYSPQKQPAVFLLF